ncbi:MAG: SpoIIE family protein phosphatase [Candidatus Eremiobacteraeota bacterium]|nr:SpoIIE family protein phosphatase [Candidatus Eremiobacteraeota bacterium]
MTLAIRGDRASSLSLQLGPRTWLLAIARGFGCVGSRPTESAVLARLRAECGRRARSARFRRVIDRPATAATALLAILSRVNGDLYTGTASHDDYVTAAASLTAVLVVQAHVYVVQAGSTAAYLARDGEVVALSPDDVFDDRRASLLFRAFGVGPSLDVTVSSASLAPGDAIVLLGRRARSEAERRGLLAQLEARDPGDRVLIARFAHDETMPQIARESRRVPAPLAPALACAAAAVALLVAVIVTH